MRIVELIKAYWKRDRPNIWIMSQFKTDWAKIIYLLILAISASVIWFRTTHTLMELVP